MTILPSINIHQREDSKLHVINTNFNLIPDEFAIFIDLVGQARGMDESILNVSKEDFAECFAMNGSSSFFNSKTRSDDPPSMEDRVAPSIDSNFESK